MNNNDIVIKLSNALHLDIEDLVEIFEYGGLLIEEEEANEIMKCDKIYRSNNKEGAKGICDDSSLEAFFNGLIDFKRGPKENESPKVGLKILDRKNVNNIMLKKVKIALELTNEDIVMIFEEVGVEVSKGKLTTFFRKVDHKHYKTCNDKHAIAFLDGLSRIY